MYGATVLNSCLLPVFLMLTYTKENIIKATEAVSMDAVLNGFLALFGSS